MFDFNNLSKIYDPQKIEKGIYIGSLKTVPKNIQERILKYFYKADLTWGDRYAKGLGIEALAAV